ncbi:hypothetical protein L484_015585 [Morus notabilis]|uniref:Alpha 1,4-glycosyltransferase domain-containing protein n=1 Tax=Morus notabilis TaxID=981085 RepID=W9SDG0_9ROSA|nr:lactosylceramide 4-alpha-galactosyltransferase [Morus notabilis]EXC23675.1 hypothetical protein L484_015585 [Morus notabilis]
MSDNKKLRIFSTICVALVIFALYSDGIIFTSFREDHTESILKVKRQTNPSISTPRNNINIRLQSIKGDFSVARKKAIYNNPFIPPFNATEEERIAWLRRKLPKLEIFKSDLLTKRFHSRVLQFFNPECEVRVFMTWISPVTSFGNREFLALESLFKAHPKGCLMILSRTMDSVEGYRILKPLIDRRFKVNAATPDLSFLFKDTPAENWLGDLEKGNKDPGEISLAQNLSNLMRLAILYKYGGIYLDTDFIVLKPLNGLRNSIGAQSIDLLSKNWTRLNNAVLIFDMNHPLLLKFIEEFASTFDGNRWGYNGPYLVSRVVQRVEPRPGSNFTVLSPMAFYPVDWTKIGGLFKRPEREAQLRWVKAKVLQLSGETYGVHLWNRQSSGLLIEEGSVIGRLISDHCVTCKGIYSS